MPVIDGFQQAVALTCGPKLHSFGLENQFLWDITGRYVLSLEVDFMDLE